MTLTISREKNVITANTLSRPLPRNTACTVNLSMEKDVQVFVDAVVSSLPVTDARLDKIKQAKHSNDKCKTVAGYCPTEWLVKHGVRSYIAPHWQAKIEPDLVGDFLVKEEKFVLLQALREGIMNELLEGL